MSVKEPGKQTLWYVKSKGEIEGPFPGGGIRRSLLLGRFTLQDQVSVDKVVWTQIADVPQVMPHEMKQAQNDGNVELVRARLREDERTGLDRRKAREGRLPMEERRQAEPQLMERHREAKTALRQSAQENDFPLAGMGVVVLLVVAAIGYGLYLGGPEQLPDPDCSSPPVAGVDWHNCRSENLVADAADLEGANLGNVSFRDSGFTGARLIRANLRYADLSGSDLSHAELREADMKGATLRNTDLSYTDLTATDLRYADLTGANLGGAVLTGALLDHALWSDGRKCAERSVGNCLESR
ncbi:MAG: pentapeptide repeat-containing protein [Gammaproteobacteria bacterium]|nr:pentapeptide repeat-containing protein [Gammaproteobacteria bacterium]MCP5444409.1 pentapeptide repeat-containing protein [Chromatiaceae bacterium]